MDNYVDNIKLDYNKLRADVSQWTENLKAKVDAEVRKSQWMKIAKWISLATGIIGIFLLILVIFGVFQDNATIGFVFIFSIAITIMAGFSFTFFHGLIKRKIRNAFDKVMAEEGNGIFKRWFADNFAYENLEQKHQFHTSSEQLKAIVETYKYKCSGRALGVDFTYNIMNGTIFNNPFDLSCGVYHSVIESKDSVHHVFEYMPVVQIKTSHFQDIDVQVTNSKTFPGFSKNEIMFENMTFREKFYVKSNDDMETMMIFTPLIQEKWVASLGNVPDFQMRLKNGKITILFNANPKRGFFDPKATTVPFMDLHTLYKKSHSWKSFINSLESRVLADLDAFTKVIDLVFAISFFQWENYEQQNKKT